MIMLMSIMIMMNKIFNKRKMKMMRKKRKNKCWNMMMILKNLKNIKFYKDQSIMLPKGIKKSKILLNFVKEGIFLKITIYTKLDDNIYYLILILIIK